MWILALTLRVHSCLYHLTNCYDEGVINIQKYNKVTKENFKIDPVEYQEYMTEPCDQVRSVPSFT